jgi:hypothetical protein
MQTKSSGSRFRAAVVLLLHLSAAAATPLADARLDIRGQDFDFPHLEAEGGDHCCPPHNDLFCQLCRVLHSGAAHQRSGADLLVGTERSAIPGPPSHLLTKRAPVSGIGARAPPRT